jgi:hypothetical protein
MTWYPVINYTPSGGPVAASGNPGSIGNGFTDINGSKWSIDSSNNLTQVSSTLSPFYNAELFRRNSADLLSDAQIAVTQTVSATQTLILGVHVTAATAGNVHAYICSFGSNGQFIIYYVNGTTLNTLGTSSVGTSMTPGTSYVCRLQIIQTNSTTSTMTATMETTGGTVVNTYTLADTTAAMQFSGGQLVCFNGTGSPGLITNISTFTDISTSNATSYTFTLPSTGTTGQASSGTVTLVGGNTLSSSLTITPTDASSGTFSPNPIVVTTGTASVPFTYTPASAGTKTVSWTSTGGNAGITGDSSQSVTVSSAIVIACNSAACVQSPYNWEQGSAGATSVQSFYAGAYLRFYITGCTSVNILCDGTNTLGYINWQVDSGSMLNKVQIPSNGVISGIAIPDTGPHVFKVFIDSWPAGNAGRWTSTGFVGIQGLQLVGASAAANSSALVLGTNRILLLGDSITEGLRAYQNSPEIDGAEFAWSSLVGSALQQLTTAGGWEYGISGCSSQGYTITGTGGMVPVFTPGNDAQSSWNKVTAATSRLSGGQFIVQPTAILDNHGENDFLQNVSSGTVQTAIQGLYTAMRAAAPLATLVGVINFGGGLRASKIAGINAFIAATGDTNTKIIDLSIDNRFTSTTFSGDGIHIQPTAAGEISSRLIPKLLTALGLIGSGGGGGGGGSTPTVYPASYVTSVSSGTNYFVDVTTSIQGPGGTINISRGQVITNLGYAQLLLAGGAKLLPHP